MLNKTPQSAPELPPAGAVFGEANRNLASERAKGQSNSIPRRHRMYEWTPAERAIYDAVQEVERMGAHPLLTDAVNLLAQARDKVADYVDVHAEGVPKAEPAPSQEDITGDIARGKP